MEKKNPTPIHIRKSVLKMHHIITKLNSIDIKPLLNNGPDTVRNDFKLGRRITLLVEKLRDLTREAEFDIENRRGVSYTSETKDIMETIFRHCSQ